MRRAPTPIRWLLRLYPEAFRKAFGAEVEDTFVAHLEAARTRGVGTVPGVWVRGVADLVRGAVRERWGRGPSGPGVRNPRGRGMTMGNGWMDLRVAARALRRRPSLTLAAVVTLALGIGATTAIFSLVNGLLFRPFGYADEAALVQIWSEHPERGWNDVDVTLPDAWAWREARDAFADVAAYTYVGVTDLSGDVPSRVDGVWATPNLLGVLGVEPERGRDLSLADGEDGAPSVVLVSHGFWVRALGADPGVVGRTVHLNGRPRTVVGVLPEGFRFMSLPADVFIPWQGDPFLADPEQHSWMAVARLATGADVAAARGAARRVSARMAAERPDTHAGFTSDVVTLRKEMLGDIAGRAAVVLLGAVGFVLLMACVNVANLLLSRAGERAGEMAVRSALGAGRGRLIRQLMAEALVLAAAGGLVGVVLAVQGHAFLVASLPSNLPAVFSFDLDVRVLAFTVGVVMVAALVFGLVPAIRIARPAAELRRSGRGGVRGGRAAGTLVVLQTALAVVLLVGGVVMARGVVALHALDTGWTTDGVFTARLTPRSDDYPTNAEVHDFHERVLQAVRRIPGVLAAGEAQSAPLEGSNSVGSVRVPGREAGTEDVPVRITRMTPGYLEALDVEVVQGRGLEDGDGFDAEPVALVNETFVERYMGGRPVLGTSVGWGGDGRSIRIVGVVEDHVERAVDRPREPSLYVPLAQQATWTRTLVVRTGGDPEGLAPAIRGAVALVDPTVPVFEVWTLEDRVADRMGGFTLIAQLMGAFAALSLVLGVVGIYGVTARAVARRTREIGVRLALGAEPGELRRSIVVQSLRRVGLGVALGLAAAIPMAGVLQGVVVGVQARAWSSFVPAVAAFLLVGGLGAWFPARGASRVDPVRALAAE